jgi:ERCC4-type nuclease
MAESVIVSVVIDSREPAWVQNLTFGGTPTAIAALEAGDLMLATDDNCILLVERKTPSDLLGSIHDGRLFAQAAAMRQVTPWSYLIITGVLYHDREGHVICNGLGATNWDWNAVQGALLTAQELGVGVIPCWSEGDYEAAVIRLANRSRGEVQVARRSGVLFSPGAAALIALSEGIGPKRAKAILDYCGEAAWALDWLTEPGEAIKISDIGDGIKRQVREALGLADGFRLAVVTADEEK